VNPSAEARSLIPLKDELTDPQVRVRAVDLGALPALVVNIAARDP
jgi:hypothetical protein